MAKLALPTPMHSLLAQADRHKTPTSALGWGEKCCLVVS
jgi:hypothetical protein